MRKSKNIIRLIMLLLIIVLLAVIIEMKNQVQDYQQTNSESISEADELQAVINNTTNLENLRNSEYTSDDFGNIQIGDSVQIVEQKIGTLNPLDSKSKYDVYYYQDTQKGSNYIFYFTNDQLAEVSVYLS